MGYQHLYHQDNDLVDPNRTTLAERARGEQCVVSKTHIIFKVYNLRLSVQSHWPPRKHVVTSAMRSDPTHNALHDAWKCPIVNPQLNVVFDVNTLVVNIGSDTPWKGVVDKE